MPAPREVRRAIERVAAEAGATASFAFTGNGSHQKVTLTYGGRSLFVTISGTSCTFNTVHEILAVVRRTLKALGYTKPPKVKKIEFASADGRITPRVPSLPRDASSRHTGADGSGVSANVRMRQAIMPHPRPRHRDDDQFLNAMGATLAKLRKAS